MYVIKTYKDFFQSFCLLFLFAYKSILLNPACMSDCMQSNIAKHFWSFSRFRGYTDISFISFKYFKKFDIGCYDDVIVFLLLFLSKQNRIIKE